MKPTETLRPRRFSACTAALACALLMACGGGGQAAGELGSSLVGPGDVADAGGAANGDGQIAGGVGSGGSGLAEGTVTGFGSVIVDGVRYDDSAASARVEDADGARQPAELHLGQRVRLELDTAGKARAIEVLPQLLGPVTDPGVQAGGLLKVAGQWVRVSATTVLADHARADDITAGTELEAHGAWTVDDTRGAVLEATLLRLRPAPVGAAPLPLLVGGIVHGVAGSTLTLGQPGGTRLILPSGAPQPAPGEVVALWVSRSAAAQAQPWPALGQRQPLALAEGATLVLGGPVGTREGRRIRVQGVEIDWPGATDALPLAPQRGDIVKLTVRRVGGRLAVLGTEVRDQPGKLGGSVELRARLSGVNWNQPLLQLRPRGVAVVLAAELVRASGCAAFGQAAVDVVIEAVPGALPLRPTKLACSLAPAAPVTPG